MSVAIGLCLSLVGMTLRAQDCHVALRGHVLDAESGEALAYATVRLPAQNAGAITDEAGYFSIPNLCEGGEYVIEIDHIECVHATRRIRLVENTMYAFRLDHNAMLGEVLVQASPIAPRPLQAEQGLSYADKEAGQGVNLGEMLRRLSGVNTLNTGLSIAKPVIGGLHSNRVAIVNNSVVLEGQQWGAEHAPEIDPFSAGSVRVLKGAAAVRYGVGAFGGAIILEPEPLRAQPGAGGRLTLGAFSNGGGGLIAGSADWRPQHGTLGLRLQGSAKRSGNLRAPDYFLANTGAGELNLSAMAQWTHDKWTHELGLSTFNQRLGVMRAAHVGNLTDLVRAIESDRPLNNRDAFDYAIDRPFQRIGHHTVKYHVGRRLSEKWKINGQYAFQYNDREEYDIVRASNANRPQVSFQLWTNVLDLSADHAPISHWQGSAGVQAQHQLNYVGRGGLIPDYRSLAGAAWFVERWRRYPTPWEFEVGARYDYRRTAAETFGRLVNLDTTVFFHAYSATGGVSRSLGPYASLTFNSALAWRPPHVNELFARGIHHAAGTYEEGQPGLQAEKAWNNNLSFAYKRRRTDIQATVYLNQIRDFIYLNPLSEFVLTVRGAFPAYRYLQTNALIYGADMSALLPLGAHWVLDIRASALRGMRVGGEESKARDWLPLMPADRLQYGLLWTPTSGVGAQTHVRLGAVTVLRQSRAPEEGLLKEVPEAYTLLNMDAIWAIDERWELGLTASNLLNARYRDYLNFFRFFADEPGVNVGMRLKRTF
ncbi:MAG: TonB-dependent receptor [Saprospiraceae bacterium]